ncbi:hypothetical protein LTR53_012089 [Teratosphaeriaceae sp. CCFEE 6253]|nr:hypothetical protein LTR53_012089 [Teratosphaeriaceae sp. CCFEE 6253]
MEAPPFHEDGPRSSGLGVGLTTGKLLRSKRGSFDARAWIQAVPFLVAIDPAGPHPDSGHGTEARAAIATSLSIFHTPLVCECSDRPSSSTSTHKPIHITLVGSHGATWYRSSLPPSTAHRTSLTYLLVQEHKRQISTGATRTHDVENQRREVHKDAALATAKSWQKLTKIGELAAAAIMKRAGEEAFGAEVFGAALVQAVGEAE